MATITQKRQELVASEDQQYFDQQAYLQQQQLKQLHEAIDFDKLKQAQAQQGQPENSSQNAGKSSSAISVAINLTSEQLTAILDEIVSQGTQALEAAAETREERAGVPVATQALNRAVKTSTLQSAAVAEEDHTEDERAMVQALEQASGNVMTAQARGRVVANTRHMYQNTHAHVNTFTQDQSVRNGATSVLNKAKVSLTKLLGLASYTRGMEQGSIKEPNPNTIYSTSSAAPRPAPQLGMAPPRPSRVSRAAAKDNSPEAAALLQTLDASRMKTIISNYLIQTGLVKDNRAAMDQELIRTLSFGS